MENVINKYNRNETEYVKEGNKTISNKPMVYTDCLYSCVALYAIGKNDAFLAHVLVEDCKNEFTFGKCDKMKDLYDYVVDQEDETYVGIAYGIALDSCLPDVYESIKFDFEEVTDKLMRQRCKVEVLEEITSEYLAIDNIDKELNFEYGLHELAGTWEYKKSQR